MRIINSEHKIPYFESKLLDSYFKGQRWCVFDIESMGLNPRNSEVILAAILSVDSDGDATVTQYFLDNFEEESMLLEVIKDELNKYDVMLTYNGKHFDIPFIKTRAKVLGLRELSFEEYDIRPFDFDLYLVLYGHSELKKTIPNLKQKTIEEYMGLSDSREDEISGAESVELFKEYMYAVSEERREELAKKILLHNHDDVVQLYKLLPVLRKTDFHKAMSNLGFQVSGVNGFKDITITRIKINSDRLCCIGTHREEFSYISFETSESEMNVEFRKDGTFEINVQLSKIKKGNINALVCNTRKLDVDEREINNLANFVNGFLVLKNGDKENYFEENMLIKAILTKIMQNNPR